MDEINDDGGPAFPQGAVNDHLGNTHPLFGGMSLRDWFAGQALAALIVANHGDPSSLGIGNAKDAYAAADSMLSARSKPGASS